MILPIYEVKTVPGKGRGLVARSDIPEGTRILVENPLLTVPLLLPWGDRKIFIASTLKGLPKEQQRQYLFLHNNFPDMDAFSGIYQTNAIPCGIAANTLAVYATICLINHDCMPNSHPSWNKNLNMMTIHAICSIKAGEEITICYTDAVTIQERQDYLKENFGFKCSCELCSLSPARRMLSDRRRIEIDRLNHVVFADYNQEKNLPNLYKITQLLEEEYKRAARAPASEIYYTAARVAVSNGDQARASIFGERAYRARVICTGEDGEDVQDMERLMNYPASHKHFSLSKGWKSLKDDFPKGLNKEQFEKWLWLLY